MVHQDHLGPTVIENVVDFGFGQADTKDEIFGKIYISMCVCEQHNLLDWGDDCPCCQDTKVGI